MNNPTIQIEKILHTLKSDIESRPSVAFRTNARIRILNTIAGSQMPVHSPIRRSVWMTYAFRLAVLALFLTGGTVYAAQSSHPKDILFPVKVLSERVALTLSPTQTAKTTVANTIIQRRAMEVEQAKNEGNKEEIRQTVTSYESTVSEIRNNTHVSRDEIEREVKKHESLIQKTNDDEDKGVPNEVNKPKEPSLKVPLPLPTSKESLDHVGPEIKTNETINIEN